MEIEKLTIEQLNQKLDELLRLENNPETIEEKRLSLIELRCRYRQLAYYKANNIEGIIEEELLLIEEFDNQTKELLGVMAKARMKVIASTFMVILRRAGISLANTDATKIARVISFISGYSEHNISRYLKNEVRFAPNDREAMTAQTLLAAIGINDKIGY